MKFQFPRALFFLLAIWTTGSGGGQNVVAASAPYVEPADVAAFRVSAGDHVTPVIVELRAPKAQETTRQNANAVEVLTRQAHARLEQQEAFIAALPARGIRILPMQVEARQADGSVRTVKFRYTNLLNGFSAYVADRDIEPLRQQPEVRAVHIDEPVQLHLNKAIDYSLGKDFEPLVRRLEVYGTTEELTPAGSAGHPETPKTTTLDGYEGQGLVVSVIDTGVDWKHPMFGGTGQTTPTPQMAPNAASANDNTKVVYLSNLSAGDPGDDYGHGTFVASNAAGYRVDGSTPARPGYGTGQNGTGVGPTPGGAVLHGMAPQARILGYKTLSAVGAGVSNSTQLALNDSVSPCVTPQTGPCIAKPVADVINMSLGGGGSASSASSKVSNNAALAGAIVVASAGNAGPGASTVGAPCMGTLVICVGASLDPGSLSAGAILAPGQIPGDTRTGVGPTPVETGAASEANTPQPGARQAIRLFNAAGGGPIAGGSASAHYVYADMTAGSNNSPPPAVTNRIALVRGTGAFATIANSVAPLNPVAILIITAVESATAVTVIGGIPTFTIGLADSNYLIDLMRTGDPGDGDDNVHVPHGTVSELPMRITSSVALDAFTPAMAGFSSRGPNSVAGSDYRNIKPDVTAPGAGILAAATPDGNPNVSGMGEPSGYIVASGTSFSGPITAGTMALIRQRLRNELGLDTTNLNDPDYRTKRFEAATVARALLQNNATNLRSGRGVPNADGPAAASINDLGSGHIDVAAALSAKAIMVAPTKLLGNGVEFDLPALNPPVLDAKGNLEVLLPIYSFASVPVVGVEGILVKKARVIIRDITSGQGAGAYSLSFQNNRNADHPGIALSFLAADGATPATSVTVPAGGSAEFFVQAAVDGGKVLIDGFEFQWYVTATHSGGRTLRMPFYYRAVPPVLQAVTAPVQAAPTVETPKADPACGIDTNGNYTLNFTYTKPTDGVAPAGFRVQEASVIESKFFDNADERLVGGANSKWSGSAQWSSQVNPATGSMAYFIPDTANQNESVTLITPVPLPAGSATLSFDTSQDTEEDFDYALVELSINNGASYVRLGTFSGLFVGSRQFDLSGFAGNAVKLRFRLTSDLAVPAPGWYVENIRITSDNFQTLSDTAAGATSHAISGRAEGTRYYRVAGLFGTPGGNVAGPYSNTKCIKVDIPNVLPVANAGADFSINEGQSAMLSGAGSSDPDGSVLTYAWAQTAGPAVTLNGADTATPSFTAPSVTADTPLTFRLTVTDAEGATHADDIVVTVRNVNVPPVANAGQDFAVSEGESAMLSGAGSSDADGGVLNYAWEQTAGPAVTLNGADTATPSFTAPSVTADTPLTFRLTVTDAESAAHADDIVVTVRNVNVPPIANAGADFAVNEGQSAMLNGAGSSDPDGSVLTYAWAQTAGPAVTLNGANTTTPSFTAPSVSADTPLTFRLTVTDAESAAHADDIVVTVRNIIPPPPPPPPPPDNTRLGGGLPSGSLLVLGLLALLRLASRRRS